MSNPHFPHSPHSEVESVSQNTLVVISFRISLNNPRISLHTFKKYFDGNLMNLPDKFPSNFWEIAGKMWTFYKKVVRKCTINFWETACVKKLRRSLMKFKKKFGKVPKKCSAVWAVKKFWRIMLGTAFFSQILRLNRPSNHF